MKILEDIFLSDSIEIRTAPDKVFDFLCNIVDDDSFRAWHPKDHVTFRWLKGSPWQEGSIGYSEEYLHGELHKGKIFVTKAVPNSEITYVPFSRLIRKFVPKMCFYIVPKKDSCVFTATVHGRFPRMIQFIAKKRYDKNLASVKKHMKEEGENLKRILEKE